MPTFSLPQPPGGVAQSCVVHARKPRPAGAARERRRVTHARGMRWASAQARQNRLKTRVKA